MAARWRTLAAVGLPVDGTKRVADKLNDTPEIRTPEIGTLEIRTDAPDIRSANSRNQDSLPSSRGTRGVGERPDPRLERAAAIEATAGRYEELRAHGRVTPPPAARVDVLTLIAAELDALIASEPGAAARLADGKWRLCSGCAWLPAFARYRVRRAIVRCIEMEGIDQGRRWNIVGIASDSD